MMSRASLGGSLPRSLSMLRKSRPTTCSMVMNFNPPDSRTSKMRMMFLCATWRASNNSCLKRWMISG